MTPLMEGTVSSLAASEPGVWPTPLNSHCRCRSSHSLLMNSPSRCCPGHLSPHQGEVLIVSQEMLKCKDGGNANLGQEGVPSGGELQKLGTHRSPFYQKVNRRNTGSENTYQVYLVGMFTFYWPPPPLELSSLGEPCHPYSLPGT